MKKKLLLSILFCFGLSLNIGIAQDSVSETDFSYGIHRVLPYISMDKAKIQVANSIVDINKHYKPEWVREYLTVEVQTIQNGELTKQSSTNDQLTKAQKTAMLNADLGSEIKVVIHYIPENTLKNNDPKYDDFKFVVEADTPASYPEGEAQLQNYLKENIVNQLEKGIFEGYDLAAVTFTVDEDGQIVNPHLSWPTKDEATDKLLLETIRKMPCWEPANYDNGTKVAQNFTLTVGNMKSCVVNTLNIGKKSWE